MRSFKPEVIILDLLMPGLGGTAAMRTLREIFQRFDMAPPPVLIFSGAAPSELAQAAQDTGAAAYLPKTATYEVLLQRVASLVGAPDETDSRTHQ